MKPTILSTDFYQLTMTTAYLLLDQANELAGFEAFVRNIKPVINPNKNYYIFAGEQEVHSFIETIKEEIKTDELLQDFIKLIEPKVPGTVVGKIKEAWKKLDKDFDYTVYPKGGIVKPFIPVFQYYGPKWIGQLIETPIINIINGRTGLETRRRIAPSEETEKLAVLVDSFKGNSDFYEEYKIKLRNRAKEYRESTSKVILESALRRAPGLNIADIITLTALEEGWNGTSNVRAKTHYNCEDSQVGGTMAHSFIMSQIEELDAYEQWNRIFPNSTILIDTYDTIKAVEMLIKHKIKPKCIRIDSEPLDGLAKQVREILDTVGWTDIEIFLSGDLTPERLRKFEEEKVPFDRCMAGTEYANIEGARKLNAGFVYKVVKVVKPKVGIIYPEKKSINKINYPGLKLVMVDKTGKIIVKCKDKKFGLNNINLITPESTTIFD